MWKLAPFIRPHRRLILLAIGAAGIASGLWAVAMLLAFPVTKVFLEEQGLDVYCAAQIEDARQVAEAQHLRLQALDDRLLELDKLKHPAARDLAGDERVRVLKDRSRAQQALSAATSQEWRFTQLQTHMLPLLPSDQFNSLALFFGLMLVVSAAHGLTVYFQEVWIGQVVQLTMRSLRARLFRRTLRLDTQMLGVEGTPALMSRFTNDLTAISQGLTLLGGKVVLEPLKAAACIFWAFSLNWRLTLLSLVCAPVGALLFGQFGKKLKRASRRQMETVARLYGVLQETLSSFRIVATVNNLRHHRLGLYRENREYFHKAMQINRIDALVNPTVELLGVTAACLAILPGAYLVLRHKTAILGIRLTDTEMDLATLAVLYTLLAGVLDPARKLSSVFSKLRKSMAACERVMAWMNQKPLIHETARPRVAVRHQQSIDFERVKFSYHSRDAARSPALHQINLSFRFGEVVAIVGSNGSGKSTLAGLLPRMYDPQEGSVRIDGVEIRELPIRELRAQIGWVPQEPMLFDRSLADNIALGCELVSPARIQEVARRAHVWDFAKNWPDGLQTPVGSHGTRLSGGQRQRVALARAMLREPSILILDEATSAIDAQSELLIHQSLRDFCVGRTTFIITHALTPTLLEFVTTIVLMEHGKVLAVGSHETLLQVCPPYARLSEAHFARRAAA